MAAPVTKYVIRACCPRCDARYQVGVDAPGRYETYCPDCGVWVPVNEIKERQ